MVSENDTMLWFLTDMHENDHDLIYYAEMFDSLHVEGMSTERELIYQMRVIDALVENSTTLSKVGAIENVKDIVNVDGLLSEMERQRILAGIDISLSSIDYWTSGSRGMPWYAKDCMGAIFAWNSGIAGWATAVTGGNPAAGAAAVIGVAAVSSML